MRSGAVGRVAALGSRVAGDKRPQLEVGDWVYGTLGWQEVARVPTKTLDKIQYALLHA